MKIKKVISAKFDKPMLVVYSGQFESFDMAPGEMLYDGDAGYRLNDDKSFDTSKEISDMIVEAQKDCHKIAIETKTGDMMLVERIEAGPVSLN